MSSKTEEHLCGKKRERCTTQKRDNARYPCAEALAVVTRKDGFSKATNAAVGLMERRKWTPSGIYLRAASICTE